MNIPVYYPLEAGDDDYYSTACCTHCGSVIYHDCIGWVDDPENALTEHRHLVGECSAFPEQVKVSGLREVVGDIDLDLIPF